MAEFVPIYRNRDLYVPAFDIKINGVTLPDNAARDVMTVEYRDSIDQIDSFSITINNWDAEKRDFKYTGSMRSTEDGERSRLFDPGQEIELWMGYYKPATTDEARGAQAKSLRLMLVGVITSLQTTFPASGQSTLTVRAQNVLRQLLTQQETHHYEDVTDSEIAEAIDRRGNLRIGNIRVPIVVDRSEQQSREPRYEHVLQNNQYDILFLIQRARRNGYDVLLKYEDGDEGKTRPFLYFGPSVQQTSSSYLLEWGKSLVSFQPTLTTTRQVSQVTVHGWDALKKKPIEVTVQRRDLRTRPMEDRQRLQRIEEGFNERKDIIVDRPFRNKQEARRYALDRLERLTRDMVEAQGVTIGTPDLRAGIFIEIRGLGSTFDGHYFIKSSTHTIGSNGYTTSFTARLEEKNI